MPQSIEMTRQQLYDLVWARSMGDAAASIPMAHVTLKKLCVKHQVPVPPQGHWKKSSPRQAADKVPLPLTMGEQRIWVKRFVQWRPTDSRLRDRANATFSLEEASPSENTAHWHGCTKRTKSALAQATPARRGTIGDERRWTCICQGGARNGTPYACCLGSPDTRCRESRPFDCNALITSAAFAKDVMRRPSMTN
jgi:hypothetical protein